MPRDNPERILVVENDPVIQDLVARQALQSAGYATVVEDNAASAIIKALEVKPDLIVASIRLPGLSGKDLLAALSSKGVTVPVIMLARKGMEADLVQAFRLGAADYLLYPFRDTEVLNAVERVLKQNRERRERDRLTVQLAQANQELQSRVREMTVLSSIGKAVTSITDQGQLFERIVDGAIKISASEMGWFLMLNESTRVFLLAGQKNLPPSLAERINLPWDDGLSSMVAMSQHALEIHGEPLERHKLASLGKALLIVPVQVQNRVIGMISVMRKKSAAFSKEEQGLLEAVADYAAIALVNARLFRALEERAGVLQTLAQSAQIGQKINSELLSRFRDEMQVSLAAGHSSLDKALKGTGQFSAPLKQELTLLRDLLVRLEQAAATITPLASSQALPPLLQANVCELAHQSAAFYMDLAHQNQIALTCAAPQVPLIAAMEPPALRQALDALVVNAIQFNRSGGKVILKVERSDNSVHILVQDSGPGMTPAQAQQIFTPGSRSAKPGQEKFSGLGISLALVKEIITAGRGKIWVESAPGKGASFHISLPLAGNP